MADPPTSDADGPIDDASSEMSCSRNWRARGGTLVIQLKSDLSQLQRVAKADCDASGQRWDAEVLDDGHVDGGADDSARGGWIGEVRRNLVTEIAISQPAIGNPPRATAMPAI